ncbi:hypothetical protein BDP27DRAFT_1314829 [Rhodocollybia butyracea]|uniref:DUF6533 domain-containing protein n=1 Tax=Rhodocollybia butyracea TaxID=206335 RepID=A0A9P5Q7C6_9AGAR|nr:hypothetical protein BDP27DRAFT_1314829 [Rhodocollybia butyracea]
MSLDSQELDLLTQTVWTQYVVSSATSVLVWDILIHFSDDIDLLSLPHKFRPPTVAYFISRYTFLASFVFQYFDLEGQCAAPKALAISVVDYIAVVTTLLQFFIRVKAIFCDNRFVIGFFAFLWLFAAGACSLLIIGAASGICNSDYSYYIPVISILIHDSCVFAAISYRIFQMSVNSNTTPIRIRNTSDSGVSKLAASLWGKNLPALSKAILREGQLYYLISLTASIVTLSLMLDDSFLPPKRLLLAPMHAALSITTGHVFREVRLGCMLEYQMSSAYQRGSRNRNVEPKLRLKEIDDISVYNICRISPELLEEGKNHHYLPAAFSGQ